MITKLDFTMDNVFQLVDVENACFKGSAWSIHAIQSEFNNNFSHFFADVVDGKIRGYVSLRIMYEEAQFSNVAVLPEFRRAGIGTELVKTALAFASEQKCDYAELEVNVCNEPAKALYEKCGFTVAGVRKKFYRKCDYPSRDAYTLTCNLKTEPTD